MKKNKIKRSIFIGIAIIILIIIISIILFKFIIKKNQFVGTWTTDGVTVYRFDKDYTGALIVPLAEYKFTYKVEEDKLFIDFENEKSTDSEYTYSFEDDTLILQGNNGKFIFTKK